MKPSLQQQIEILIFGWFAAEIDTGDISDKEMKKLEKHVLTLITSEIAAVLDEVEKANAPRIGVPGSTKKYSHSDTVDNTIASLRQKYGIGENE